MSFCLSLSQTCFSQVRAFASFWLLLPQNCIALVAEVASLSRRRWRDLAGSSEVWRPWCLHLFPGQAAAAEGSQPDVASQCSAQQGRGRGLWHKFFSAQVAGEES